jgi:AcrR family transcriptional regulator
MEKKAEYKSAIRSKRLIVQAFIELMQEKSLEKITVTDIVKRADVNRGTFYAHYADTRAVIEQIENEIIKKLFEFLEEYKYENFFQNPLPLLLKVSKYLEEDIEFYRILINSSGAEQFLVKLKQIFVKYMETDSDTPVKLKKSPEFYIRINFFAGGIINLYQVWFREEMEQSLDDISLEISKLITSSSSELFE